MKIFLLFTPLTLLLISCSSNYPVHNIPPKNTFVKEEKKEASNSSQVFQKDDHRYDERYRNFNYDRLGYSNNMGAYYGYYDRQGYFYNNQYYPYDNRYTYEDRYNRRGMFDVNRSYDRAYIDNDWNRNHRSYAIQPVTRVYHRRDGIIPYGDISYQNSHENVKNRVDTRGY